MALQQGLPEASERYAKSALHAELTSHVYAPGGQCHNSWPRQGHEGGEKAHACAFSAGQQPPQDAKGGHHAHRHIHYHDRDKHLQGDRAQQ